MFGTVLGVCSSIVRIVVSASQAFGLIRVEQSSQSDNRGSFGGRIESRWRRLSRRCPVVLRTFPHMPLKSNLPSEIAY